MFTESAELYDAIYAEFKDYAAETAQIAKLVRMAHPGARSLLDVALLWVNLVLLRRADG